MKPNNGASVFPFRVGNDGRAAQVSTSKTRARRDVQLILTNPAERLFLPEFGGGVRRLVFEGQTKPPPARWLRRSLPEISRWLGHRVTLEELEVSVENETIEVEIIYRIAGTEDKRVLRFQRSGG